MMILHPQRLKWVFDQRRPIGQILYRPVADEPPICCSLCQREVPSRLITLHHLMPKQKGGRAEDRTPLCKPCHNQIHSLFSNTQLAQNFSTLEALKSAPQLGPFLKWIRKQKNDRSFRSHTSRAHPRYGRKR